MIAGSYLTIVYIGLTSDKVDLFLRQGGLICPRRWTALSGIYTARQLCRPEKKTIFGWAQDQANFRQRLCGSVKPPGRL